MTTSGIFYTLAGDTALYVPELSFVTPLKVKRQGMVYNIIFSGTPGNLEVLYSAAEGSFTFEIPFEAYTHPIIRNCGEPIDIMYK